MNLTVLAWGNGWHVQDLQRAAHDVHITVCDFRTITSHTTWGDTILVRTMPPGSLEQVVFRMDVLHAAEKRGIPVFNPPRALECCIDKYLTTSRLQAAGLPTPPTWCGQRADDALIAYEELGGDVVIKPLFGSEGRGLVRVRDKETAWRVCHAIERIGGVLYLQKFIAHYGWDVRAFVLGDQIIGAIRRQSTTDWRTNVSQGGQAIATKLSDDEVQLAVRAAIAAGCPIAGVDLLPSTSGWLVLEVNAVPGWRALSRACEIDVAEQILDFIRGRL